MAPKKRMIPSELWESSRFVGTTAKQKLLSIYMISRCDCIGLFSESPVLMKVLSGIDPTESELLSLPISVEKVGDWVFWISDFCFMQYGPLCGSGMHQHIAKHLYDAGLWGRVPVKPDSDFSFLPTLPPTLPPTLYARVDVPIGEGEGKGKGVIPVLEVPKKDTVPAREKQKQHTPNDVQEMTAYGAEIGLSADECAKAYDYYASKGWKVSNSPMKDWKATLRNWKRRFDERQSSPPPAMRPPQRPQFRNQFDDMRELGEWVRQRVAEGKPITTVFEDVTP